jgi:purine-binding chemotaxis protein CheW
MNIAEIRKKARVGKSEHKSAVPGLLGDSIISMDASPEGELVASLPQRPLSSLDATFSPVAGPSATDLVGAKERLATGEDRLDQLFSWLPQQDELLFESSDTRPADGKRVEAISRRWLAFSLGSEDYALDISVIREILKPREITEIPRVPEFLLGIISLRGNIIPIIDLKRRLGLGVATIDHDSRIIVCQEGDRLAGLLIDRITQVTSIQEEGIEPPPAIFSGRERALLDGVGRVQGNALILLNLSNVLTIDSNGL